MHQPNKIAGSLSCLACCLFILVTPGNAAESPEVAQLRNDIRSLEREVRELTRKVEQLQQARDTPAGPATGTRLATVADPDPTAWIAPEKWDRVRAGMTAQQVILVLGTPVSMRSEGNPATQVLFYTLPIGDGGFLTGTVRLRNDEVLEVQRPVLK